MLNQKHSEKLSRGNALEMGAPVFRSQGGSVGTPVNPALLNLGNQKRVSQTVGSPPPPSEGTCLALLLTTLLRYHSHTIRFTCLKHARQWLLGYSQICTTITTFTLERFPPPEKKPHSHERVTAHSLLSPTAQP